VAVDDALLPFAEACRVSGVAEDVLRRPGYLGARGNGRQLAAVGEQRGVASQAQRPSGVVGHAVAYPKPWTDEVVRAADVVITMGCGDACPVFPGKRYEEWVLTDPARLDVAAVRPVRDEIERHVLVLLDELGVAAQS
jgi:arsenate reductase